MKSMLQRWLGPAAGGPITRARLLAALARSSNDDLVRPRRELDASAKGVACGALACVNRTSVVGIQIVLRQSIWS